MDLGLHDKNVLVTGGSKGIGLACARTLLKEGARVAIVSRSRDNLDAAIRDLGAVHGIVGDLTDADAALAAVNEAEDTLGPIDILVNSAGAAVRTVPAELNPGVWRRAMEAKFYSYINVIDPLVTRMAGRGRGVIVNIIGQGGKVASPTHLPGGSANAALMLASVGLGAAYAHAGVRVVGINPGRVETERVTKGLEAEARLTGLGIEATRAAAIRQIPIGRLADPQDVANLVAFIASDAASYLTGINISVDGAHSPVVV